MHPIARPFRHHRLLLLAAIIAACTDPIGPFTMDESPESTGFKAVNAARNVEALAGTYRFTLCHPSCAGGRAVGHGILVIESDSLVLPFASTVVQQIRQWSAFIVWRGQRSANACFRVSARRSIGDREYYPGIIPEALTAVTQSSSGLIEIPLYGSPDASFHAEVTFDSIGNFKGIGIQGDWNGRGPPQLGTIEGSRIGEPRPGACFPDL